MPPSPPRIVLRDPGAVAKHFAPLLAGAAEIAAVGFLDPEWRLLGTSLFTGSARSVSPSIRRIVRDALAFDAVAAVLVHRHPGGDPSPSPADLAFTRRLTLCLDALDIRLHDHLVLAGDRITSLRTQGYL